MISKRRIGVVVFCIAATAVAAMSLAWACTTTADGSYITISPDRGPVNTDVTVTGKNWAPDSTVNVVWAGTGESKTAQANSSGGFTIGFRVTGPESSSNNTYYFQASQGNGTSNAPFTVEATQSSSGGSSGGSGSNTTSGAEEEQSSGGGSSSTSGGSQSSGSGSASGSTSGSEGSSGGNTSGSTSGGEESSGSGSSQGSTSGGSTSSGSGSASQSTSGGAGSDQKQTSGGSGSPLPTTYSDGWAASGRDADTSGSRSSGAVLSGVTSSDEEASGSERADQATGSEEAAPVIAPDGGGVFGDLWSGFTGEEVPSFGSEDSATPTDDPFRGVPAEVALSGVALVLLMSGFLVAELRRRRARAESEIE